jgi:hypothetical protein
VTSAALAPDGALLATRGDGVLVVWDRRSGSVRQETALAANALKQVALDTRAARFAVALSAEPVGSALFDARTLAPIAHEVIVRGTRRVGFFANGAWIATHYGEGAFVFDAAGTRSEIAFPATAIDAEMARDHASMTLLLLDGTILALAAPATGSPAVRALGTIADALAVSDGVAVRARELVRIADGRATPIATSRPLDVAVSADGALAAVGAFEGDVIVVRVSDGALVATIPAHAQRAAFVAFADDGDTLLSAGWDGVVRMYDARVFRDASHEERFRLDVHDALDAGSRVAQMLP